MAARTAGIERNAETTSLWPYVYNDDDDSEIAVSINESATTLHTVTPTMMMSLMCATSSRVQK